MHEAWNCRGTALCHLSRFEEATESYDKALQIKPNQYQAWNNKGYILLTLDRPQEAFTAFDQAVSLTNDSKPWRNRTEASLILSLNAISESNPAQSLHYLNEARKSESIIGPEQWMSLVLNTILSSININNLPSIRDFLTHAGLDQQLFPLIRAIDYLVTGNEELIEKLSPEYRKIVTEVAKALKERQVREHADV